MLSHLDGNQVRFSFETEDFSSIKPNKKTVGQDRAIELLKMALKIDREGYNIYISAPEGVNAIRALEEAITELNEGTEKLKDAVYVYSFDRPDRPKILTLRRGDGKRLKDTLCALKNGKIKIDDALSSGFEEKANSYIKRVYDEKIDEAFEVNLYLDRSTLTSPPLIYEKNLSHSALFGKREKGEILHMAIKSGSFQEASGGYLVLDSGEITSNEALWNTLKNHLESSSQSLETEEIEGEECTPIKAEKLRIPTKAILIGSEDEYEKLSDKDNTFLINFKVSPEFDYQMDSNRENAEKTISYLKEEFSSAKISDLAFSEILRYSSELTEDRKKLSTEMEILIDLIKEAEELSSQNKGNEITGSDIRKAIDKRHYFSALTEEKINREIERGIIVMDLKGERVGLINGLAVMDRGLSSYGTPVVISATVAPGSEGIVNIEHEAGLSGGIHDKGVLILEGYLRHKYSRFFPLSLYAGICLEQNYGEIDGDSASSAELCALLSAIGEIPIRQDIAITGSVNQMGILQPVGGINEKITGFYRACKTLGLTGKQGVIIPRQNITSIILPYEVEDAIDKGLFHIWAIDTIDDGFGLLSGLEGGSRDKKGVFPPGSFHRIVEDELRRIYRNSQKQS